MEKRFTLFLLGLVLSIGTAFGQAKINGTVVSQEDGEAVVGASVMVQGTTTGTVTDIDGKFSLNVPAGKKLVVSYIGMVTQTLTPKDGMKVGLTNDNHQLTEVVVTGMTQQDKRLFSGAATKIDASKAKLDGMADVSRSLEGRAAGVSVQNVSGTFGTAPKIRVRGATSIYGSSKPLWVVDGVIMEDVTEVDADNLSSGDAATLISSAIAGLNADDIESFQILKDGSATSIYGARAMGGVIVVTTKKGKAGSNRISYTGEYTMRLRPSYSQFNIMNSQEQIGHLPDVAFLAGGKCLLDGVLVRAREGRVDQVAHIRVTRMHRDLVAVLHHPADLIDVGEIQPWRNPLRVQVQRDVGQVAVAGALTVAEEAAFQPVGPGHQRQLGRRNARAPVVVRVHRQDD